MSHSTEVKRNGAQ